MAEFPALPLFTDAYLADTRHLNATQHGGFLLLLMMAWRMPDCALPDDDEKLARWSSMDMRTWRKNKPEIMAFWELRGGKFVQKRLLDERKRAEDKRDRNVQAGRASALKRHNTRSTDVQPNVNLNPTIPNPNPIKEVSNPPKPPRGGDEHPEFQAWYERYPHKVGRAAAARAFGKARMKATPADLADGLERYITSKPSDRAWCNPATWLNQERWKDQPQEINHEPAQRNPSNFDRKEAALDRALEALNAGFNTSEKLAIAGPDRPIV